MIARGEPASSHQSGSRAIAGSRSSPTRRFNRLDSIEAIRGSGFPLAIGSNRLPSDAIENLSRLPTLTRPAEYDPRRRIEPMVDPVVVEFPLRGEWVASHTPAEKVPSHGVDQLGQRYAYDFLRIDRNRDGWNFCRASLRRYHLLGTRLDGCYGWSRPIHAPFAGTVVAARDGWPERTYRHMVSDVGIVLKNALLFDPRRGNLKAVLGNHVILKIAERDVCALVAHARTGSVRVRDGDTVAAGAHVADVGHSGNSTAPHLHFQLMDPCGSATKRCARVPGRRFHRGYPARGSSFDRKRR